MKSISGTLGTEEWTRVRIGVGKPALEDGRVIKAGGKDLSLVADAQAGACGFG